MLKQFIAFGLFFTLAIAAYQSTKKQMVHVSGKSCELPLKDCTLELDEGKKVKISFNKKQKIDPNLPFLVGIDSSSKFENINVEVHALTHEMPEGDFDLTYYKDQYVADVSLGICIEKEMLWQAKLKFIDKEKIYYSIVKFTVVKE